MSFFRKTIFIYRRYYIQIILKNTTNSRGINNLKFRVVDLSRSFSASRQYHSSYRNSLGNFTALMDKYSIKNNCWIVFFIEKWKHYFRSHVHLNWPQSWIIFNYQIYYCKNLFEFKWPSRDNIVFVKNNNKKINISMDLISIQHYPILIRICDYTKYRGE